MSATNVNIVAYSAADSEGSQGQFLKLLLNYTMTCEWWRFGARFDQAIDRQKGAPGAPKQLKIKNHKTKRKHVPPFEGGDLSVNFDLGCHFPKEIDGLGPNPARILGFLILILAFRTSY